MEEEKKNNKFEKLDTAINKGMSYLLIALGLIALGIGILYGRLEHVLLGIGVNAVAAMILREQRKEKRKSQDFA